MEYPDQLKKRMKRMEGQIRGILRIMEQGKDCKDIVSQLSAVKNSADKAIAIIVALNLATLLEQTNQGLETSADVDEAVKLLVKSR